MEIPPGPFTAEVEERGAIGFVSAFPGRSAVRRPRTAHMTGEQRFGDFH